MMKDNINMETMNQVFNYFLSFKPYVLLPLILLILALLFRVKPATAVKATLTIGIGFIGIFIVFDYFVAQLGPAVNLLISRTGLHFNILDVGWPPLAAITWSFHLAPLLMVLIMAVNFIMLALKQTRTVNIDIWNFWHFILVGALVSEITGDTFLAILATLTAVFITLKLSDFSAQSLNKFANLSGIAITTLSAVCYFPIGVVGDRILSRIPILNKINADPENLKKRFGIMGEPVVIGFILGTLLAIGAGYNFKQLLELAFSIAAVIFILPMMCGILAQGLMPISDGIKEFLKLRFPDLKNINIGLDNDIISGYPSIVVTALLLMPIAIFLSFILPGIKFIPLGDLANMIGAVCMIVVAVRGNVVRACILFIPVLVGKLYIASYMAGLYTSMAQKVNFRINYQGLFTSFLDGGNLFRFWIVKLFAGAWWALLMLPFVILIIFLCWRYTKNEGTH